MNATVTSPNERSEGTSAAPVLNLNGITKRFGPLVAVNDLSLRIGRNEVVGLVGENGAGKSTLLKIITGVQQQDEGVMEVHGRPVKFRTPLEANANGIGIVHQEQALFTNMTVAENIVMSASSGATKARRIGIYNWRQANREAARILERIGADIDPRTNMSEVSFARRQMVEIGRTIEIARESARALSVGESEGGVPLVILDEPTSVLERNETDVLEKEIRRLHEIGSVIFVSHRLEEVLRICDRIVVMRHGQIVADRPTGEVDEDTIFHLMIGEGAETRPQRAPAAPATTVAADATPALQLEGLTREGTFRDVSLAVPRGRVVAIVGTVGSGREQICRSVFGAEPFDSGTLTVAGRRARRWSVRKAINAGVAYLPSERVVEGIVGGLSAARNLTLTHPGPSRIGPFLSARARRRIAEEWFESLDVRPRSPELELGRFSGGNQQKVALAKWLVGEPRLLILDHPLRGLDPGASAMVTERIREACRRGAGLLLLADTLEEALELGDEIIVMRDREVTARFDTARDAPTSLDLIENMV